ncbi:MAG: HpcH/HpaI aldolase/citrate lyase family protein [Sulfurimonas sp.]|nr:HpcH/HpaI aldolase/citrate lyase family protein [Sulfurimonas sp.]
MNKKIHYTELGATLFIPATHKDISKIIQGNKYPNLKSIVIDTEDSISDNDFAYAIDVVKNLITSFKKNKLLVFIRPRNIETLKELLKNEKINQINGFVLPKFSLINAQQYLDILKPFSHQIMPSIEGEELFNTNKLIQLKDILVKHKEKIILVRFGLEDMLRQLSMKRRCEDTVFDITVTSSILGNFLAIFKSAGFGISGGVYPCFNDKNGFIKDVKRDLKEGLFSKTIIHPAQIKLAHEIYKVTLEELNEANSLLSSSKAIINLDAKMGEVGTMSPYAKLILQREKIYGIRDEI